MAKLKRQVAELASAERAPRTVAAYAQDWRKFEAWCREAGREALPAEPETLELFTAYHLAAGSRSTSVQRYISAIAARHREAGHQLMTASARGLVTCARRKRQEEPRAKKALMPDDLRAICRVLGRTKADIRMRALLLFGFASSLRRSELAALNLGDITFADKGALVHLRRSKTDQVGDGRKIGIFPGKHKLTCPVLALKEWIRIRGDWAGPLFTRFDNMGRVQKRQERMQANTIAQLVQEAVAKIGLDSAEYGAHSLRAGCVTAALSEGVQELVIMRRTGHRSVNTLRKYDREANAFACDPLAKAL